MATSRFGLVFQIKEHPVIASVLAIFSAIAGSAGFWAFFSSRPLGQVIADAIIGLAGALSFRSTTAVISLLLCFVSIGTIVLVAVNAGRFKRESERLAAALAETERQLHALDRNYQTVVAERDRAVAAHKDTKHNIAVKVLQKYSKLQSTDNKQTSVTVRFANYGHDHDLAQQIEGFFKVYANWPVTLDGSNKPALPRADRFKVVFDVGSTALTYSEVMVAIAELLGMEVGKIEFSDRDDSHNLIVMVLPSVGAEPMSAEPEPENDVGHSSAFKD